MMAVRTDTAASGSPLRCFSFYVFFTLLVCYCRNYCKAKLIYSHLELCNIGYNSQIPVTSDYQRSNNIPPEIARTPALPSDEGSGRNANKSGAAGQAC